MRFLTCRLLLVLTQQPVAAQSLEQRLQVRLESAHRAGRFGGAQIGVALPDGSDPLDVPVSPEQPPSVCAPAAIAAHRVTANQGAERAFAPRGGFLVGEARARGAFSLEERGMVIPSARVTWTARGALSTSYQRGRSVGRTAWR